jgi:cysteine desulfurase / selenocysteine lyase
MVALLLPEEFTHNTMNDQIRALFPVTERAVYLNHAAVSPLPSPTLAAIQSQLTDVSENGSSNFRRWLETKESARRLLANLLSARPEQVAFMRNTSDSLATVANGLNWRAGDNLVTFQREFPANIYPWLRLRHAFGVEVRMCSERDGRVDLDEMIGLIDERTRIVSISQVQFASGFRADLRRLGQAARAKDALFVVDVIQGLGVVPTDVNDDLIDVAAGASHKWLLGPEGVGFLYLSDRARARIEPTLVGWISVPDPDDYSNFEQPWRPGTLAWETGTGAASLLYGVEASLRLLSETGVERIASYLEEVTDHLCESLDQSRYEIVSSRLPDDRSQIVSIRHRGGIEPMALYAHLKQRQIITAPRGGGLRIAPHFYNTLEDIDQLLASLP